MEKFRHQWKQLQKRLRRERMGTWASTTIQKSWRRYTALKLKRVKMIERPHVVENRLKASIVMQSLVRRFLARVLRLKIIANRHLAATAIQKIVRGHNVRRVVRKIKHEKEIQKKRMAAHGLNITIELKQMASKAVRMVRARLLRRRNAALDLQRLERGRQARERVLQMKIQLAEYFGVTCLAIHMQRLWRGRKDREKAAALIELKRKRRWAAIQIERVWRGHSGRLYTKRWRVTFASASLKLQRVLRGHFGRCIARQEKATVQAAWTWLGTDGTEGPRKYAKYLPRFRYPVTAHESHKSYTTILSVEDQMGEAESFSAPPVMQGEEVFTCFDKHRFGTVAKAAFQQGLIAFCKAEGHPLQTAEVSALTTRYSDGDNMFEWRRFLTDYRAQGGKASTCRRHARILCLKCAVRNECERDHCHCKKAHSTRGGGDAFRMCVCGHPFSAHALKPPLPPPALMALYEEKEHLSLNKFIKLLESEPEGTALTDALPVSVIGIHLEAALRNRPGKQNNTHCASEKQPSLQRLSRNMSESGHLSHGSVFSDTLSGISPKRQLEHSSSPTSERSAKRISTGLPVRSPKRHTAPIHETPVSELQLAIEESLFQLEDPSEPLDRLLQDRADKVRKSAVTGDRGGKGAALRRYIDASEERIQVQSDLHGSILSPIQSLKELSTGFILTSPVPRVAPSGDTFMREDLVASTDPVELYISTLRDLCDVTKGLLEEKGALAQYAAHRVAIFERHWFKFVKDMKSGSLDPALPIDAERRKKIEMCMVPEPRRAAKLDLLFKDLGYHDRRSGHYGGPPDDTESERPMAPMSTLADVTRNKASPVSPTSLRRRVSNATGLNVGRLPGSLSPKDRIRKSLSMVQDPENVTNAAVQEMAYSMICMPQMQAPPFETTTQRHLYKYICKHPACGHVSSTKLGAEAHAQSHKFKAHLGTSSSEIDQYLRPFYPEGISWRNGGTAETLPYLLEVEQSTIPGASSSRNILSKAAKSILHSSPASSSGLVLKTCRIGNCGAQFPTSEARGLHERVGHTVYEKEAAIHLKLAKKGVDQNSAGGRFSFVGPYSLHPPFPIPLGGGISIRHIPACKKHIRALRGCERCVDARLEAEAKSLPAFPVKMYRNGSVMVEKAGAPLALWMSTEDLEQTPIVTIAQTSVRIRVVAIMCDGLGEGWLAARQMPPLANIMINTGKRRSSFTQPDDNEVVISSVVDFIRMTAVNEISRTVISTRDDFYSRKQRKELSPGCKYVRSSFTPTSDPITTHVDPLSQPEPSQSRVSRDAPPLTIAREASIREGRNGSPRRITLSVGNSDSSVDGSDGIPKNTSQPSSPDPSPKSLRKRLSSMSSRPSFHQRGGEAAHATVTGILELNGEINAYVSAQEKAIVAALQHQKSINNISDGSATVQTTSTQTSGQGESKARKAKDTTRSSRA